MDNLNKSIYMNNKTNNTPAEPYMNDVSVSFSLFAVSILYCSLVKICQNTHRQELMNLYKLCFC